MKNLGFGMMRLPVNSGPEDINFDELNQMVDEFIDNGYTYFDTSYVYHNGKSEEATRKAVVERYPRDKFTVATKFPTFNLIPEEEIETIFQNQLDNLGVDFIDYYLIHNIQTIYYDDVDGKGGIVKKTHLFDHAKKWLEDGKIKHLGISFHSSPELLDRVLEEHPEIEFVQIPLNPIDWNSDLIRAGEAYEIIKKHGKKVIIMEPIKGGGLSSMPEEAEAILKEVNPENSIASWSLRYALDLDDVIAVLSGMSNIEQMRDNLQIANEAKELTKEEHEALDKAIEIYRENAPIPQSEIDKYQGLTYNNVPVPAILQAYSICQVQPDPGFSDDNNYVRNAFAELANLDLTQGIPRETVVTEDGEDITDTVEKAVAWLQENTF